MTYNLADSGCHPVRLSELVSDPAAVEKLLAVDLHYPPVHIIAPQMLQCNPAQKDENSGTCCLHTTCPEVVACKRCCVWPHALQQQLEHKGGTDLCSIMFFGRGPWQNLGAGHWQVGGTDTLRELCASWHGAKPENVLVTVGAAEANSITVASLLRPGELIP